MSLRAKTCLSASLWLLTSVAFGEGLFTTIEESSAPLIPQQVLEQVPAHKQARNINHKVSDFPYLNYVDSEYRSAVPSLIGRFTDIEEIRLFLASPYAIHDFGSTKPSQILKVPNFNDQFEIEVAVFEPQDISANPTLRHHSLPKYITRHIKTNTKSRPVILFAHAGGFLFRDMYYDGAYFQTLSNSTQAVVVVPRYRLSVERPFPAPVYDTYSTWQYINQHAADLKVDPNNLIIMGESSGGGLSAATVFYNRDHLRLPIKAQVLIYPMLDHRTGTKHSPYNMPPYRGQIGWDGPTNAFAWRNYGNATIIRSVSKCHGVAGGNDISPNAALSTLYIPRYVTFPHGDPNPNHMHEGDITVAGNIIPSEDQEPQSTEVSSALRDADRESILKAYQEAQALVEAEESNAAYTEGITATEETASVPNAVIKDQEQAKLLAQKAKEAAMNNPKPSEVRDLAADIKVITKDNLSPAERNANRTVASLSDELGVSHEDAQRFKDAMAARAGTNNIDLQSSIVVQEKIVSGDTSSLEDESMMAGVTTADHMRLMRKFHSSHAQTSAVAHTPDFLSYFSPSEACDFSQMPATFIYVGELDLFANESVDFSNRLLSGGSQVELHVVPGLYHLFDRINPKGLATQLYQFDLYAFIIKAFYTDSFNEINPNENKEKEEEEEE